MLCVNFETAMVNQEFKGFIQIDDFYESFISSTFISKDKYMKQWKEGMELIKFENKSMIIVDYYGHDNKKFEFCGVWWLLYKTKQKIMILNGWIPKTINGEKFSFDNWKNFIPDYEEYSNGGKTSEWVINLPPKPKVKQDSDKICLETLSRKRWPSPRGYYPFIE
ncbi:hypothetical protein [Bathymodiolus thermophilus thioautotrophic gill symbiont]|uniref:CdiI C-terminal domain-containing protein n=1 Tax=Bathymodiolus thermophilus thioautotrophic gill symbiont TaxID=2360 RepID=A0A1J5U984_9GAMM|nr:hypothetical protein [Bathymodiolus thermophilus thioautotrophic gill symbiont]OIR25398.1 hypothetical protein BGC33_06430 [Bathymodiolus thermophilus thioautotrophic gill symbiont]